MLIVIVLLGTAVVVMALMLILHALEVRSIKQQLADISAENSNEVLHSHYIRATDAMLINAINDLLKKMRGSVSEYQEKSHTLEQMMTNISHDLRTPLTSALGYINIIIDSDLPEDEKDREIRIIEQRLVRLEELVNSFFEFSKIVSGERRPEIALLNLVGVLQEAIVHYYDDFCGQEREIRLDCDKPAIQIESNAVMLMRIFDNLISNSYKHGMGTLYVSVKERQDGRKVIRFENGIDDDELDVSRIFDEFYTTDISRTKGNTGLGLAIAKQFTELLGGTITAECRDRLFAIEMTI